MKLNLTNKVELVNGELVRCCQHSVRDAIQSLLDSNGGGRVIHLNPNYGVGELTNKETFTVSRFTNSD